MIQNTLMIHYVKYATSTQFPAHIFNGDAVWSENVM